jgi:hypothetical protein
MVTEEAADADRRNLLKLTVLAGLAGNGSGVNSEGYSVDIVLIIARRGAPVRSVPVMKAAKEAGLLTPEALERLLTDAPRRRQAADRLLSIATALLRQAYRRCRWMRSLPR